MLKKITSEESPRDNSTAELDALKHRDWVSQNGRGHIVAEDNTTVSPTEQEGLSFSAVVCSPGTSVGAADEGAPAGSEAEEGAGAALQHSAHRIQPHPL